MKRIIMMLALTALLVVALSLSALSAFAAQDWTGSDKPQFQNKCTGGDQHKNCRNA